MIRALRHRTYRTLFVAQVVSLLGSGLATVALGLLAYDLSGSRASLVLGALFAVKMVAYVVVAPLAAAALRSVPRRTVMVASDLVRVAVACTLPFVAHTWQIFVLVFVLQAASAAFIPTYQATLPRVLPDEDDYTGALSLSRLVEDLETIGSPLIAALLLLVVPVSGLFFGTALGFAASAVLVLSVALPAVRGRTQPGEQHHPSEEEPEEPWGRRARQGMLLFFRTPALRPVLLLNLTVAAAVAFVLVQTVVIVRADLGLSESWVPVFLAVNGAGAIAAAVLLGRVIGRVGERRLMLTAGAALALLTAVAGFVLWGQGARTGVAAVAIGVLWLAIGLGWSFAETPMGRIIKRSVPSEQLDQAYAAQFSLSHACWLVTYPLAGVLGQMGLDVAAWTLAAVAGVAAAAAAVVWPSSPESPDEEAVHLHERVAG
ncbi:MFS transporter [Aestuariimicrobium soli]|uniref:MFS transporter n=1 Tax=Aestuariimicrobium soli TaxID=2035834 RepID=UPI003EBA16D8